VCVCHHLGSRHNDIPRHRQARLHHVIIRDYFCELCMHGCPCTPCPWVGIRSHARHAICALLPWCVVCCLWCSENLQQRQRFVWAGCSYFLNSHVPMEGSLSTQCHRVPLLCTGLMMLFGCACLTIKCMLQTPPPSIGGSPQRKLFTTALCCPCVTITASIK
jgi:hypothetical protein